jgi:presenilin-like A22 family membrane protease
MKHTIKITIALLVMFLVTQFIGLAVIHADPLHVSAEVNGTIEDVPNPYLSFLAPPEPQNDLQAGGFLFQLILAFIVAIFILLLLMKFKIENFLKIWFFVVVVIALFLSFLAFEKIIPVLIPLKTALIIALVLAIPFAFIKIFRRNFLVHNLTELLIYPGIAAVFVPILSVWTIIVLLILISAYDIWAVWHSGIMQKMAKYQINKLKIFSGFFVPYVSRKVAAKIKNMKKSDLKKKKVKINIAILGGGDIVFPIITAGVILNKFGFWPALLVILGAAAGLTYLFLYAEKKKFYPAMPFITAGIFIGMIIGYLVF